MADGGLKRARPSSGPADEEAMLLLLEGLSPSPTKKVNRSSGDLLDATGEDGKVLPELLSDQGGNTVTSTWPKPSARKQVLTFGASWDNKSGVDFLNRDSSSRSVAVGARAGAAAGSAGFKVGKSIVINAKASSKGGSGSSRRHSDPPVRTATSTAAPSSGASTSGCTTMDGQGQGLQPPRRRPSSTGSSSVAYFTSSSSASSSSMRAGLGSGLRKDPAGAGIGAAGEVEGTSRHTGTAVGTMGVGVKMTASTNMGVGVGVADAQLLAPVDVRDMRLTTSPAGSVESNFWPDGGGGDDDGDGFDPREAAHAAVDRLMGSTASAAKTKGKGSSGSRGAGSGSGGDAAAAGGGGNDGGRDAELLEELLLDGLGLQKVMDEDGQNPLPASPSAVGEEASKSRRSSKSQNMAKVKGSISASPIDEFPMTPAADGKHEVDVDVDDNETTRKPGSGGTGGSGRSRSKSGSGKRFKKVKNAGGPSPPPSVSSSSSTPLSTLSFNSSSSGSTPQSAVSLSNISPASIASMTLDPSLWKLVERGETCPFPDCAFTVAFLEEKELAKSRAKANAAAGAAAGDQQGTEEAALIEIGGAGNNNMNANGGRAYLTEWGSGGERPAAGSVGFLKSKAQDENRDIDMEGMMLKSSGGIGIDGLVGGKENKSRCRHFHTLCGCRHTRGLLKGRLFQTNQLDKARNHQKKHAHADAAAAASSSSPAGGGAVGTGIVTGVGTGSCSPAETPSPMPLPSSQGSTGSCIPEPLPLGVGWGSQTDEAFSQGASQEGSEMAPSTPAGQGSIGNLDQDHHRHGRDGDDIDDGDGDGEDIVIDGNGGHGTGGFVEAKSGGMESLSLPLSGRSEKGGSVARSTLTAGSTGGTGGSSNSRDGRRTWTDAESDRLREVVEHREAGETRKNWQWVAARVCEVSGAGRKTPSQCKMRWERILNPGVKRGLWTKEEDQKLKEVAAAMEYKWSNVAKLMGGRTYKQCRERYTNYLKEGLNVGPWSKEEDQLLLTMHARIGNKWAEIARHLKDRSENMIKNEYMKLSRDASHRSSRVSINSSSSNSNSNIKTGPNQGDDPNPVDGGGGGIGSGVLSTGEQGKKAVLAKKRNAKRKAVPVPAVGADINSNGGDGSSGLGGGGAQGGRGHLVAGGYSAAARGGVGLGFAQQQQQQLQQQQQEQQLEHWQGLPPFDQHAHGRGDGDVGDGLGSKAASSAVAAMAMASASALDAFLLPITTSNTLGSGGIPNMGDTAAADTSIGGVVGGGGYAADGRVPIAAAADRAAYPDASAASAGAGAVGEAMLMVAGEAGNGSGERGGATQTPNLEMTPLTAMVSPDMDMGMASMAAVSWSSPIKRIMCNR